MGFYLGCPYSKIISRVPRTGGDSRRSVSGWSLPSGSSHQGLLWGQVLPAMRERTIEVMREDRRGERRKGQREKERNILREAERLREAETESSLYWTNTR